MAKPLNGPQRVPSSVVPAAHILVVDDDPGIREVIAMLLAHEGYQASAAGDGETAVAMVGDLRPDLVLMDVTMPVMSGLQACRLLRTRGETVPIVFLSCHDSVSDQVHGLDAGACDYLVKPFASEELFARIRAALRHHRSDGPEAKQFCDLTLTTATRRVWRGDREILLTRMEFDILEMFFEDPGTVLTREDVERRIWHSGLPNASNTLDVFISGIRRKLEAGREPRLLITVRGIGWALRSPELA